MELRDLERHLRTLATLEESESPIISAYFTLGSNDGTRRTYVGERTLFVGDSLPIETAGEFKNAMRKIVDYLDWESSPSAQGAAVFSRAGRKPFFLALQFALPLPSMIAVGQRPNIYHLVEMKDNYHRYVVVVTHERSMRIVEVNLGEATKELWLERPELRAHIDRTWSKERYHRRADMQTDEFIKENIKMLDRVMSAGGYSHLILAGNAQMAWRFRNALPYHLSAKFVDVVEASKNSDDVITATIAAFLEREEQESLAVVDELLRELHRDGLAAVGIQATLGALRLGMADVLVLEKDFDLHFEKKGEMVLLAQQSGTNIEVVNHSDALHRLGGIGCLLRYRLPLNSSELATEMMAAQSSLSVV